MSTIFVTIMVIILSFYSSDSNTDYTEIGQFITLLYVHTLAKNLAASKIKGGRDGQIETIANND